MGKISTIPSLTLDGFINNKKIQMTKLFEYFLASDYSQSNTFYTGISSLKYILAKVGTPEEARGTILSQLNKLYSEHFDTVNVSVDLYEPEGTGVANLHIEILATDDGVTYTLTRELQYTNSGIEEFNTLLDKYYEQYSGEN